MNIHTYTKYTKYKRNGYIYQIKHSFLKNNDSINEYTYICKIYVTFTK